MTSTKLLFWEDVGSTGYFVTLQSSWFGVYLSFNNLFPIKKGTSLFRTICGKRSSGENEPCRPE